MAATFTCLQGIPPPNSPHCKSLTSHSLLVKCEHCAQRLAAVQQVECVIDLVKVHGVCDVLVQESLTSHVLVDEVRHLQPENNIECDEGKMITGKDDACMSG